MSNIDPSLSNDKVIPAIESDLFAEHPDARFAAGILAVGGKVIPGLENEYRGYFDLRRNVYVHQTGQLHESELNEDGTDRDQDDERSVAFGIVENRVWDQRLVAATRLIIKGFGTDEVEQRPLPVEEFCPDIFPEPVPSKGIEVSRLIARHEKAGIQEILRWRVYAVALGYIASNELGPTYGVIEPWLQRHLQSTIPVSAIGEARYVPHYLDFNLPIEVHTDQFIDQMNMTHPGMIDDMQNSEGSMSYFGRPKPVDRRYINIPVQVGRRTTDLTPA